jgi:hypothetical protein
MTDNYTDLREQLHHILIKNGIDGKQYNNVWSDLETLITQRETAARIETANHIISLSFNAVVKNGDIKKYIEALTKPDKE